MSKKVWVLIKGMDYEGAYPIGVFNTEKKVKAHIKNNYPKYLWDNKWYLWRLDDQYIEYYHTEVYV